MLTYTKKFTFVLLFQIFSSICFGQALVDSTKILKEIKVTAYLTEQNLLTTPSTVSIITSQQIENASINSLVLSLNMVSGVKMEERSPGSYRLSIRGSLLRSPYGVRNIKIYFDGLPLTDASGNTYFNLIDQAGVSEIEVLKGPDGSLFGANSGGVVLLNSKSKQDEIIISGSAGGYGFARENVHIQQKHQNYEYSFHQAFQYAEGYRDHSLMQRSYFQTHQKVDYMPKAVLKFSGFYSDLGYQTPGGLTASQVLTNPKMARLATPATPSAIAQKAGIYNKTFFGGFTHEYEFNKKWQHSISLSGMDTDFENPFISNYEFRKERSLAVRTFISYQNQKENTLKYSWNVGWEFQNTQTKFRNYKNIGGEVGDIMEADLIKNQSQFIFTRFKFEVSKKLNAELSSSLNLAKYDFEPLPESISGNSFGSVKLKPQLMPKLALSYQMTENSTLRGIISRGYATPTKEEIRASDRQINTNLKAEDGWNYEIGLRTRTPFESIYLNISAFYYRLNNAIVKRVVNTDEEMFVNAGGTNQKGIETEIDAVLYKRESSIIQLINFKTAITLNDFSFRNYSVGSNNYSGNLLTGVPKYSIANSVSLAFIKNLNLFLLHQYNSKTSLNDAESVFAKSYHLVNSKINWQTKMRSSLFEINFGVNNLLNEDYSLGNDLNAFGARYYNPAAKRNIFIGFKLKI